MPSAGPAEFVVGPAHEDRLQRPATDRFAGADELQRALDPVQRQEEAGRGARVGTRIQRDDATVDVDHRRAGRTAGRAGGRLQIEGVEIVVLAAAVLGCLAVEPGDGAGQDRELLAGVVAHDADLPAGARAGRRKLELGRLDEAQRVRVVAEEAEVVDGIPVDRRERHLFVIQEHGLGHHRPRRHHVTVGQDQAPLRVHHESGGLGRGVPVGIERAGGVDPDGDDAGGDTLQRVGPRLALGREQRRGQQQGQQCDDGDTLHEAPDEATDDGCESAALWQIAIM